MANRSGLHKVVKTVRGKKGAVRRSYWVKSEGAPGAAPKHGMAHRLLKVAAGAALLGYAAHKASGYMAEHAGGEHGRRGALGAITHGVGHDLMRAHAAYQEHAAKRHAEHQAREVERQAGRNAKAAHEATLQPNALAHVGRSILHHANTALHEHMAKVQTAAQEHVNRRNAERHARDVEHSNSHPTHAGVVQRTATSRGATHGSRPEAPTTTPIRIHNLRSRS